MRPQPVASHSHQLLKAATKSERETKTVPNLSESSVNERASHVALFSATSCLMLYPTVT